MNQLRNFYRLAAPFWLTRQSWKAWLALGSAIACSLLFVQVVVLVARWQKAFFDALSNFGAKEIPQLLLEYLLYLAAMTALIVIGNWILKRLKFAWREHMTVAFERRWLSEHRQYRLQLSGEPDNPDQRIAEDLWLLSELTLNLVKSFCQTMARLISFIGLLWAASGVQKAVIGGVEIEISGYLVWCALGFSVVSTLLMHWVGNPLRALNVTRQHTEADYRSALLLIRENAAEIAFMNGEETDRMRLRDAFRHIRKNWRALIKREVKVETFTALQMRLTWFIPIAATLPLYLQKSITLGGMMQAQTAFSNVVDGFDWFINSYRNLILLAAVVDRLSGFQSAMDKLPEAPESERVDDAVLKLENVTLMRPNAGVLAAGIQGEFRRPGWVRISGPSGTGKTTLLRSIAGLWPWRTGKITLSCGAFFVPQKPYLPKGTLRSVLSYPNPKVKNGAELKRVLRLVGLPQLENELDKPMDWGKRLSGGETQRVSAARVLLCRPKMVFLDEPTGQLDSRSAEALLRVLQSELPDTHFFVIAHQNEVDQLGARTFELHPAAGAAG